MPATFPDSRATAFDIRSGVDSNPLDNDESGNKSTGALSTGIGFGPNVGPQGHAPNGNFSEGYVPGKTDTDGTAMTDATGFYIGGGSSKPHNDDEGEANATPITTGYGIAVAVGTTIDRDDAAEMKSVVAAQDTADGGELDATSAPDYTNQSGVQVRAGDMQFGVHTEDGA